MNLSLSDRLSIYNFLPTKDLSNKILRLAKADRAHLLTSSAQIRKDRSGLLRLPKSDSVKAEREADLALTDPTIFDKSRQLHKAKAVLAFRRFNCWLCY